VFVSDGPPARVAAVSGMSGFSVTAAWATDYGMTLVPGSDDPTPYMTTFVPGPGSTRFLITVFAPVRRGRPRHVDAAALAEEMRAQLPGLGEAMERSHPGMHTTDTVDYDVIMSGELLLELDDGKQVHLKPGDIVIQTGTRHAWRNPGKTPCVMYSVLVGAPRR